MAIYGQSSPFSSNDIPQRIGCKTNIGGYFFDAYIRTEHVSKVTITSHPVETGADITDHSYVEADELVMEVGMSDACISYINGQFTQGATRSLSAIDALWKLQKQRKPINVLTRLKLYKNMLIETISVPDDYATQNGLKATVTMREIIIVSTKIVSIASRNSSASKSKSPQKTAKTKSGTKQAKKVNTSILKSSRNALKGVL